MAELFWPTHEILKVPVGRRNAPVELHGLVVLHLMVTERAVACLDAPRMRRPVLASSETGKPLDAVPIYLTRGSLRSLLDAGLVERADDRVVARLEAALPAGEGEAAGEEGGTGRVRTWSPTDSGRLEAAAHATRLAGELALGRARPDRYVIAGAARGSDGRAVGTGALCAVLRDKGGDLEVRVVTEPADGPGLVRIGGEVDTLRREAVVAWGVDADEWGRLLAGEAARSAALAAEKSDHERRKEAEGARHAAAVAAIEGRWRDGVAAVTGEDAPTLTLPTNMRVGRRR